MNRRSRGCGVGRQDRNGGEPADAGQGHARLVPPGRGGRLDPRPSSAADHRHRDDHDERRDRQLEDAQRYPAMGYGPAGTSDRSCAPPLGTDVPRGEHQAFGMQVRQFLGRHAHAGRFGDEPLVGRLG